MPNYDDEKELFAHLAKFDTPSICNALEIVAGERRDTGFTRTTMVWAQPQVGPFAGRARTATLRAVRRTGTASSIERRMEYYRYAAQPGAVVVIEDLDRPAGLGCFWGEVNSTVHANLKVAGVVTSGGVRDLDVLHPKLPILAGAVTPSHAFVDIEQMDLPVSVCGMTVSPGQAIHADRHGAVVMPDNLLAGLPAALETMVRKEAEILSEAKKPGFDVDKLEQALRKAWDIH